MKNLLIILVLFSVSLYGFGQSVMVDTDISHHYYDHYVKNNIGGLTLSYDLWMDSNDWWKMKYDKEVGNPLPSKSLSAGTYLQDGSEKILYGIMLQTVSTFGCLVYVNSKGYKDSVMKGSNANAPFIIGGLLNVMGLASEISGVMDIGKAGLVLNENGVGIKIKF